MRLFKNIIFGLIVVILLAIIAAYFYIQNISKKALPDYNENISITGLTDEVNVYRDEFAVPHVFAKNEGDLYKAVGYLMAEDRLWQMDLLRRATTGRLSEIFGKDMIKSDQLLRSLRITEKSEKVLAKSDEKVVKALEAYAEGVNQFIDDNIDNLPPEFTILGYKPEKWKPVYSVNLVGYMAWDLKMGWNSEIILHKLADKVNEKMLHELIPNLDMQTTYVIPDYDKNKKMELLCELIDQSSALQSLGLEIFNASNNWAVAGKKSTTGKPIFANDMHLGLFAPGIWYQMHQVVEGKLNVTGVVLPGAPFVVAGHNDSIAWGMTNVMSDDIDFYKETINPDNPYEYKYDGQWKKMEVRIEKIKTKDGKVVEKEQKYTGHGAIISEFKDMDEAISFSWVGNIFSNEIRTIYLLNRAKNWCDFRNAVKTFVSVSQNIAYADVNGNIGLQTSAGIPIRNGNGIDIMPGDTSLYDWKGVVPFEELPYSYNPESGYISSANNNTVDSTFGHYISTWFYPPYRIDRIREMLEEKEKLSVDDFKRMHSDQKSKLVEKMLNNLVSNIEQAKRLNKNEKAALAELKTWDMVMSREAKAPAIFESFYLNFVKNTFADEMGKDLFKSYFKEKLFVMDGVENVWIDDSSEWYDNVKTRKIETRNDIIIESFKDAVKELEKLMGNNVNEWEWGKIHQLILKHPMGKVKLLNRIFELNSPAYPVSGSFHTVSPWSYPFTDPYTVNYGPSHRHIYSTANWDESFSIIPTGISGIPASPFYCDQTKLYVNGKYHVDYVSRAKVEEVTKFKMKFTKK
ncbi:MAG: penicillin acylase family protein [Chlorobi bacterium]|nr:penicillin acylase family protein [Chlorobiota bacterium]